MKELKGEGDDRKRMESMYVRVYVKREFFERSRIIREFREGRDDTGRQVNLLFLYSTQRHIRIKQN
jgi:hypothetical protein